MRTPVRLLVAVAAGGACGSLLRYTSLDVAPDPAGFPATTLVINVLGSALLAILLVLPAVRRSPTWAAALGPGVLGGFTTFAATSEQARALMAQGRLLPALTYLGVTLAASLLAVLAAGRWAPAPQDLDFPPNGPQG